MRGVGIVADQLQRVVGLDGGADIGLAAVEERPAAILALDLAQVAGEPLLHLWVDLAQEMLQQDVLGRDGGVGLQLESPVAVRLLHRHQRPGDIGHGVIEKVGIGRLGGTGLRQDTRSLAAHGVSMLQVRRSP
jgi:hypothetical protein